MPRIGYAVMFTDVIGLWPRGGFSYYLQWVEDADSASERTDSYLDLNLEAHLVISPVPHFGILVGATLDLGAGGERENKLVYPDGTTETDKLDVKFTNIGLNAGLVGYF